MQQSSLIVFCEECGAANEPAASLCLACQQPFAHSPATLLSSSPQAVPIRVALPVMSEVVAGTTGTPADLLPGTVLLGRYQIHQEIGHGGFSTVYLARDLARRRSVAVKRIALRELSPRQVMDATETWNHEIKALSSLKSVVGVPRLYENFADAENWYLVMQYIEGRTLEDYLQQAPGGYLSEIKVVKIGIKLAQILHRLHSQRSATLKPAPIIFRDVKPANIMITPTGKLYLIDFGIARFFRAGQKRDTTPLGSPGYAAPEQYGRAQTDVRADIYGLGATLQTLLTGRDPLELAQEEPSRNPIRPSARLCQFLNKMLAPEVSQRPPTMIHVKVGLLRVRSRSKRSLFFSWAAGAVMGLLLTWLVFVFHFFPDIWVCIGEFSILGRFCMSLRAENWGQAQNYAPKPPASYGYFAWIGFVIGFGIAMVIGIWQGLWFP